MREGPRRPVTGASPGRRNAAAGLPACRPGAPLRRNLLAEVEFLQQRRAHDLAVLGTITALALHLLDALLSPGHVFLLTLLPLGAGRDVLHHADQVDRRLTAALVHVRK